MFVSDCIEGLYVCLCMCANCKNDAVSYFVTFDINSVTFWNCYFPDPSCLSVGWLVGWLFGWFVSLSLFPLWREVTFPYSPIGALVLKLAHHAEFAL